MSLQEQELSVAEPLSAPPCLIAGCHYVAGAY